MRSIISSERIPIKLWLEDIEAEALVQAKNLANVPFALWHIPLMPDCHEGYGMPIGAVLATKEVVIPNAVGVDIGCGMCATKTSVKDIETTDLKKVMSATRKMIPLGNKIHKTPQDETYMPEGFEALPIVRQNYRKALKQIGTLGGGNHFIEIQKGSDGFIWLMVHSGSRNLGYRVASWYIEKAENLDVHDYSATARDQELAFLPLDMPEAQMYLKEMQYAIDFAFANRKLMMQRLFQALESVVGDCEHGEIINKPHNFAAWEMHFGENVLIHRKGATRAFKGELGMIPGSQGSTSYIVKGLGNPESFMSCSHGAGRRLSRKEARLQLNLEEEIAMLEEKGVVHAVRFQKDLDEAPGSYKDIYRVMENQDDLVDIVVELEPMAVIKGT